MIHLMVLGGFLIHLGFSLNAGLLSNVSLLVGTLFLVGPLCYVLPLVQIKLSSEEYNLQKIITAFRETKQLRRISRKRIMERSEIRAKIKEWAESLPDKEFTPGLILVKIGYKYVTYLDLWLWGGEVTEEKEEIEEFYENYVR